MTSLAFDYVNGKFPLSTQWSARNLGDVLALESEVAQAVASEIRITLTPADAARLPSSHGANQKAHDAYLHGRYLWNTRSKKGLEQSISYYQQAVKEDPQYALAYAGIADSYILLADQGLTSASDANPAIKSAAIKAVASDPNLADAHMVLADAKETEWDWVGAEQEYKRALELNPGLARAHHWYAILLSALKRHDEAASEVEQAVDLEPLSPRLHATQCRTYYLAGRFDQALLVLNRSPILRSDDGLARQLSGLIHLEKAEFQTAIAELHANAESKGAGASDVAYLAYGYALAGRKKEAPASLRELQDLSQHQYVEPGWIAMVWAALGDKDNALNLLRQDYRLHSPFLMSLGSDPVFEPLHSDSRFQELLRDIGLPSN